ncbi:MAG: hypothetical protein ABI793_02505 [Flavobacterium sp.]
MKIKKNIKLAFYETKWFKLICLFSFFGWLFYMMNDTFQINTNELIEIKATVNNKWKSGGTKNPIKLYFETKEFSNQFGIYTGGIFGRWTEVTNTLEQNSRITIKIHKKNKKNLNIPTEVIPIYYLNSDKMGLIFDENEFNEGEKSSDNRFIVILIFIFIICFWNIIKD